MALPTNHLRSVIFFLLVSVQRVNETSDRKRGMKMYVPLFVYLLTRGYTRRLLSFGNPPFWRQFTPFCLVAGRCTPVWLKRVAGVVGDCSRSLVVVVARQKGDIPDPLKRDKHTTYDTIWFRDFVLHTIMRPGRVTPTRCSPVGSR